MTLKNIKIYMENLQKNIIYTMPSQWWWLNSITEESLAG